MQCPTVSSGTYGELLLIFSFVWQIVAMILYFFINQFVMVQNHDKLINKEIQSRSTLNS